MGRVCATAVLLLLALLPGTALAADSGQVSSGTVTSQGDEYPYLLYTPAALKPGSPLIVMVHGCQTTAEQELHITQFDALADREHFAALYPEVDATSAALPSALNYCWKFFYPVSYFRGNSDAAAIAQMTQVAMAKLTTDPERVYIDGVSAGGLMASVEAAAYADLYAAVGLVESAGYADGPCFTDGVGIPVEDSAELARVAMGPNARVVPRFVIGSDGDLAFPKNCADKAIEQGLRTDNLVISGSQTTPLSLTPSATAEAKVPNGYGYTVSTYRDPDGCLIGQRTIIHGMPHAWPGGTTDTKYNGYNDRKAPDGAGISWAFFSRYTKSSSALPCAEAPQPASAAAAAPRACRARWLLVRLPKGARHVRATVNGRHAKVRHARRGVRVRLPATTRARTKVVARARTRAGKRVTRRRTYRGCGR